MQELIPFGGYAEQTRDFGQVAVSEIGFDHGIMGKRLKS